MKVLLVCLVIFQTACTSLQSSMNAETLRTAINECQQQNLDVLAYRRMDGSVFAIRCLPKDAEISKSVIVRPKVPMNLFRPFLRQEVMVTDDH